MRVKIRFLLVFAAILLGCAFITLPLASASSDSEPNAAVREVAAEIGENYVRYPQLDGLQNEAVQSAVNDEIVTAANITQRLITLSTLQPGGTGLQVEYTSYLNSALFSTVISAKGMMETLRSGHLYTALSYDLLTGERLRLSDFFADPDAAVAWMEAQLTDYADELSMYLENTDVIPLPVDSFAFDAYGITFFYPYRQFSLLSGYSGAVQFQYGELQPFLITDDRAVPSRLGAVLPTYTDAEIKAEIETAVSSGTLPCLPVALGDSIPDLITEFRLVRTPDQYPGGRYFQFEAPQFRRILLLSDSLTSSYEHSVVEGILAMRMNLFGIQTGATSRARWHEILGEPAVSVALDASLSADYGLPPGTADYYTVADRQLMLYADENDVLYAVRLMN